MAPVATQVAQPLPALVPAPSKTVVVAAPDPSSLPFVEAKLNYLDHSVTEPFNNLYPSEGEAKTNVAPDTRVRSIHNLRALSSAERRTKGYVTDYAGFEVVEGFGGVEDVERGWEEQKWEDEEWIKERYYDDTALLLKKRFGASSTFIFDHTVRKRPASDGSSPPESPSNRHPVDQTHVDQTAWAGLERVRIHLGEELASRVKKAREDGTAASGTGVRALIVNVWRPLRGPVVDHPLAVADYRTVDDGDLVTSKLIYPHRTGETLLIRFNPKHEWYYLSKQATNEALLLKCYDSANDVKTPHTAFALPDTPADAEPRWSIEVRALVILHQ